MAALFYLMLQVFLPFINKKEKKERGEREIPVWAFTISTAEAYISIGRMRRSRTGRRSSPRTPPWYRLRDAVCMRVSYLVGFCDGVENVLLVKTSVSSRTIKIGQGGIWIPLPDKQDQVNQLLRYLFFFFIFTLYTNQHSSHFVSLETQWNLVRGDMNLESVSWKSSEYFILVIV